MNRKGFFRMDGFTLGPKRFHSRLFLGTGKFPLANMRAVIEAGACEMVTLALRRANVGGEENILEYVKGGNMTLLPNTSGARNAEEAVRIAHLARELGCGDFIKIEVIPDSKYLMPDNYETVKATEILAKEGFVVLPYMNPDLVDARRAIEAGAAAVMPLAAPIGSNKGLLTREAMELVAAAVLVNTAVATAGDPVLMAEAFKEAVRAGRRAYLAKAGRVLEYAGDASSPLTGFLGVQ